MTLSARNWNGRIFTVRGLFAGITSNWLIKQVNVEDFNKLLSLSVVSLIAPLQSERKILVARYSRHFLTGRLLKAGHILSKSRYRQKDNISHFSISSK